MRFAAPVGGSANRVRCNAGNRGRNAGALSGRLEGAEAASAARAADEDRCFDLVPAMFAGPLTRASLNGLVKPGSGSADVITCRDYAHDRHKSVDDRPFWRWAGHVASRTIFEAVEVWRAKRRGWFCCRPRAAR